MISIEKQIIKKELSVIEFLSIFDTDEYCENYMKNIVFRSGEIYCFHCGTSNPYKTNRGGYRCRGCKKDFNIKQATIFNNSKLTWRQIFFLVYLNASNKKNQSSVQYSKHLGITQTSSWKLLNKIRYQYSQDQTKLKGIVEVDEAFVSRNPTHKKHNWGGISTRKEPILGLMERGGRVIAACVPNRKKETVISMINHFVEKGSTIYTDGYAGYRSLIEHGYYHKWVEHSVREYVNGEVHTNSIEGFWSHFKKSVRNAHHNISSKHCQAYLNEAVFKYNNRNLSQMDKFNKILENCIAV